MKSFLREVNRNLPDLPTDRGMRYLLMARRITLYAMIKIKIQPFRWLLKQIHLKVLAVDFWYYRKVIEPKGSK